MKIRQAIPDDIPSIMNLERQCATAADWSEEQYRGLFATGTVQRLALVADRTAEDGSETGLSARAELVGFLVARHLAPEWELENIVVAPLARRRGVGKRLLEALLAAARETRSEAVYLEFRESNAAARALYEKMGFRETGRRKSYYTKPLEDAVLCSLALTKSFSC